MLVCGGFAESAKKSFLILPILPSVLPLNSVCIAAMARSVNLLKNFLKFWKRSVTDERLSGLYY